MSSDIATASLEQLILRFHQAIHNNIKLLVCFGLVFEALTNKTTNQWILRQKAKLAFGDSWLFYARLGF